MHDRTDTTNDDSYKILLVDDDPNVVKALEVLFEDDYDILTARCGPEAIELAKEQRDIAVALLDIKMAEMDGVTAARKIREANPSIRIIFHTGHPGEYNEHEIDQTEEPFDYVVKGRSSARLFRSVRNAYESYCMEQRPYDLIQEAENNYGLIGRSAAMQQIYKLIGKVARADAKVMILGETGTGKELVARAIHYNSRRRDKRLGILNCNHKSTDLVEAELFGYKEGAFTGATRDRDGLVSVATGGTVFLDEIGDLSHTTQMTLLRLLETGEYRRVGAEGEDYCADVRVLCATHRDLVGSVKEGRFREDLYYRLRGAVIELPPLRERREDIPLLVERFRDRITLEQGLPYVVFDSRAIGVLLEHDWPGNVRELKDTVESLVVLADSELVTADEVSRYVGERHDVASDVRTRLQQRMEEVERSLILESLVEARYSITKASELLGVDRTTLSKKIKGYGVDVSLLKREA